MGRGYVVTHNTWQLGVGRVLHALGNDPSLRCCIISNTFGMASKPLVAIKSLIEKSEVLKQVFPRLVPGDKWTDSALIVERPYVSKDPSVQAAGVHGNVLGSRIDLLVIDDILDYENARIKEHRVELINWVKSTLLGRLTADARVIIIGNAYHPDDLMHVLAREPRWVARKYPVLHPTTGEPLWPDQWPAERIEEKQAELGQFEFNRQMLCIARDDTDARFKRTWIERCLEKGKGKRLAYAMKDIPAGCRTITGVDLAVQQHSSSDLTVLFTIIVWRNGTREVLCIESGRWSGPEIVSRIIDTHRRYQSIIIVENNAAQAYVEQFLGETSAIPVRGFTTGRNKAHPEFGVESIAVEMASGHWVIPCAEDGRTHKEVSAWIDEMLYYDPDAHTGDRLMACWFAREGIRMGEIVAERGHVDFMSR
jgi:hypothetical protein